MTVTQTISMLGESVTSPPDECAYTPGMTVHSLLERVYDPYVGSQPPAPGVRQFVLKYFGAKLGYEVVTLDGVTNQVGADQQTYLFWELSVNSVVVVTGIDFTELSDGDSISWNYVPWDDDVHSSTRYDHIRAIELGRTTNP